jgi:(1->4)-alpha-D-glucan 1-alpha-D-glucosylmutase
VTIGTRLPVSLAAMGGWADTLLVLPHRPYRDLITGTAYDGGELPLARVLDRYPVALLVEEERAEEERAEEERAEGDAAERAS